jgi:hypothetical protein
MKDNKEYTARNENLVKAGPGRLVTDIGRGAAAAPPGAICLPSAAWIC